MERAIQGAPKLQCWVPHPQCSRALPEPLVLLQLDGRRPVSLSLSHRALACHTHGLRPPGSSSELQPIRSCTHAAEKCAGGQPQAGAPGGGGLRATVGSRGSVLWPRCPAIWRHMVDQPASSSTRLQADGPCLPPASRLFLQQQTSARHSAGIHQLTCRRSLRRPRTRSRPGRSPRSQCAAPATRQALARPARGPVSTCRKPRPGLNLPKAVAPSQPAESRGPALTCRKPRPRLNLPKDSTTCVAMRRLWA